MHVQIIHIFPLKYSFVHHAERYINHFASYGRRTFLCATLRVAVAYGSHLMGLDIPWLFSIPHHQSP